ncbi:hypothetical protein B2J93_845 [Marssonina coronariae]|uniref:Uncharacterized protein n=1 Tax=Diplocarpon coronariae TaxID=2795749 RepID=A0A218ZCH0_9HELO|nr:hypothetical protein B2J93_845 [Marssonina coronariae]
MGIRGGWYYGKQQNNKTTNQVGYAQALVHSNGEWQMSVYQPPAARQYRRLSSPEQHPTVHGRNVPSASPPSTRAPGGLFLQSPGHTVSAGQQTVAVPPSDRAAVRSACVARNIPAAIPAPRSRADGQADCHPASAENRRGCDIQSVETPAKAWVRPRACESGRGAQANGLLHPCVHLVASSDVPVV